MKKVLILIFGLCICFVLMGCGDKDTRGTVTGLTSELPQLAKHSEITKIADYRYEITYTDFGEGVIEPFLKYDKEKKEETAGGACSSLRSGNFYGRNFDFHFCDMCTFIIKVPKKEGVRFASVGIVSGRPDWTPEFVEKGMDDPSLAILPWGTLDGINENGVVCNTNVVPAVDLEERLVETNPGKPKMYYQFLPRYILDNATSAKEIVEKINEFSFVNVKGDFYNIDKFMELHCMVADKDNTYVIEVVNGKVNITEKEHAMTNFYLTIEKTPHSMGIERYNILNENYEKAGKSMDDMAQVMEMIKFTNAYDSNHNPLVLSDNINFIAKDGVIVDSSNMNKYVDEIKENMAKYAKIVKENNRDPKSGAWQTVHTSVYDIEKRKLRVYVQENYNKFFEYTVPLD